MRRYSFWFFFWARCFGLWGFFHWRWWYDDVTVAWVINMIHSWLQWLGHCWRWILWFFSIFSSILFTAFGNEASLKYKIGKSGWYLRAFGVGFDKTYVLESPNFPSISLSLFELQLPLRPSIFRARDRVIIFASLSIYFYNCNRINKTYPPLTNSGSECFEKLEVDKAGGPGPSVDGPWVAVEVFG